MPIHSLDLTEVRRSSDGYYCTHVLLNRMASETLSLRPAISQDFYTFFVELGFE